MDKLSFQIISWFLLFMLLLSYVRAVTTNISQSNIEEKIHSNPKRMLKISAKQFNKKCDLCHRMKFDRSSHCSTCKVCITRRDHHCPWITKCVGYSNTQYFINYCIWTWLAGIQYLGGYLNFYNKIYEIEGVVNNIFTRIFVHLFTCIMLSGTLGLSILIITQINAIFNEASFNERRKEEHLETYYLCCVPKSLEGKSVSVNINDF
jgi:hypothetical protein